MTTSSPLDASNSQIDPLCTEDDPDGIYFGLSLLSLLTSFYCLVQYDEIF